jgi:phenylpropionate dioxygenase-like ring-hydroxylating dioxygenase large terminal subunit
MTTSPAYPDPIELTTAEEQYPLGPGTIDARHYTDPVQYGREVERILLRSWFPICPASDLAVPRDFVVWDQLGQSVVVVRTDDGEVVAWHNVCQHRGARLVDTSGHCQHGRFNCPWHGFSYDLRGVVRGVPLRPSFDATEIQGLRTPIVRSAEWAGFVWLAFSDDVPPLDEYLGEVGRLLDGYGLSGFETRFRTSVRLQANWKVVVDAFNETWHVPFTHQETLGNFIQWRDAVLRITPPHSWMSIPVRGFTDNSNSSDVRRSHVCHYLVFPNTIFSCFPTHLQMWSAWPVSTGETIMGAWGIVGPAPEGITSEKWAARNERDWNHFLDVLAEDVGVINQAGTLTRSLGWRRNMFNTAESRLTAFHDEVRVRLRENHSADLK